MKVMELHVDLLAVLLLCHTILLLQTSCIVGRNTHNNSRGQYNNNVQCEDAGGRVRSNNYHMFILVLPLVQQHWEAVEGAIVILPIMPDYFDTRSCLLVSFQVPRCICDELNLASRQSC